MSNLRPYCAKCLRYGIQCDLKQYCCGYSYYWLCRDCEKKGGAA